MTPVEAWHLPGLEEADVAGWRVREYEGGVALRFPNLTPEGLARQVERIARSRAAFLADLPVAEVVRAVDAVAQRFATPGDAYRDLAERALPAVTGYSPPMVRLVLGHMAADWRSDALERLLRAELEDPAVLDAFRRRPGGGSWTRALGPDVAFHVFSGNVPGVAVTSIVRSLLVKAATLGKTASGEPILPALFARALAETAPRLAACLAVTYWPGGTAELEEVALRAADTVVLYGGAEAERALRERTPVGTRLVVHGPRISFAVVCGAALDEEEAPATARSVARAAAVFDQQGCVSPHLVYVTRDGEVEPERFAAMVAGEMEAVQRELPRGRIDAGEAAAIHRVRASAEFREIADAGVALYASAGTEHTVVFDPDPAFTATCLNRVLFVKPIERLTDLFELIRPYRGVLQSVAVAGAAGGLAGFAELLGRAGLSRITTLERLPWPPPAWHHDGGEPLRELVRWVDLEE